VVPQAFIDGDPAPDGSDRSLPGPELGLQVGSVAGVTADQIAGEDDEGDIAVVRQIEQRLQSSLIHPFNRPVTGAVGSA
jgi:hypothetical protein